MSPSSFTATHAVAAALLLGTALAAPLSAQTSRPTATVIQKRPMTPVATPTVARPTTPPVSTPATPATPANAAMPQNGLYTLAMTATNINGHPAGSAGAISKDVTVSWSGSVLSLVESGGTTLKGQVTNNHLAVSAQTPDGTLSLGGTPSAHYASGTFTLHQGSNTASGGFTLTPPGQSHMMKKLNVYGAPKPAPPVATCNWWCSFKAWF